ncbi:F-box protein At3g07870-like [Lolium perenne]|uniref:F-box protein At3g07870-like n=1 Tax=Lolium perenne TaxID=4522 RepID=UPI0021EAD7D6|nr:F-box protein At3g07870-like [Lolium perenne]
MAAEQYLSVDVLADILQRLPSISRRRARLVCRHWRDVVNKRTTEMQSRAKPLIWDDGDAYVIGDLSSTGSCRELWKRRVRSGVYRWWDGTGTRPSHLVGVCNGLLCVCVNEERAGGSLTVSNPATGEALAVPPLPCAGLFVVSHRREEIRWDAAYSFACHPMTGKYKVVHVPWSKERLFDLETVQVLTLGDTAWREVPAPAGGARCDIAAGIISIDGTTHWVKVGNATRIVSFDLDTERFAPTTTPLPAQPDRRNISYHLTEVHGRLGFVMMPDVWVLDQRRRWSRRYRLEEAIPRPHFVFGKYVLTTRSGKTEFFAHRPKGTPPKGWRLECDGVERVGHPDHGTLVAEMTRGYAQCRTFPYVETTEPLGVYETN